MNIDTPCNGQGCLRNQQQNPARKHYGMHMNREAGQRRVEGSSEVITRREAHKNYNQHEPGDGREKDVIKPCSMQIARGWNCVLPLR